MEERRRRGNGMVGGAKGDGRKDFMGISTRRVVSRRQPSQQSHRIQSRRAMMSSVGPGWALVKMKNRLRKTALAYTTSRSCMLFLAISTLLSCLFYILATYLEHTLWVKHTETAFGILFLVDYVLSVSAAPVPLSYALSKGGLTDLVSCLPAFGSFQPWMSSLAFVRYLRVGKAIRVMRNHKLLSSVFSNDAFTIKATLLIVKVLGVVLMTSAILFGMERGFKNNDEGTGAFSEGGWQWHDALYFTIVTLSTVGYGDISPVSTLSRLLVVVVIVFALTYVPLEVGKLVDAVNARPKHRKGFSRGLVGKQIHVVLAMPGEVAHGESSGGGGSGGSGGEWDADKLESCVNEFFDEDQSMGSRVPLWVIVMAPSNPSPEIITLCHSPKYHSRVVYFKGTVTNPRDMAAVCAEYADCIFLFPSASGDGNCRAAEERTHLAAKAVRRYLDRTPTNDVLMSRVKALSQTGSPRRTVVTVEELHSKDQLLGFGVDHVICHDELKMAMFAFATLCPSFLPLVANTVRSSDCTNGSSGKADRGYDEEPNSMGGSGRARGDGGSNGRGQAQQRWGNRGRRRKRLKSTDTATVKGKNGAAGAGVVERDWLEDYTKGVQFEIYSIPLEVLSEDSSLWSMTFRRAARAMYDQSNGKVVLLAAVEHNDVIVSQIVHFAAARRRRTNSVGGFIGATGHSAAARAGVGASGVEDVHTMAPEANLKVELFPDENFRFSIDAHLLVLAETQMMAEDLIFNFQGNGDDESSSFASSMPRSSSSISRPAPGAEASWVNDSDAVAIGPIAPYPSALAAHPSAVSAGADAAAAASNVGGGGGGGGVSSIVSPMVVNSPVMESRSSASSAVETEWPLNGSTNPPSAGTLLAMAQDRSFHSSPAFSAAGSVSTTASRLPMRGMLSRDPSVLATQMDDDSKGQLGTLKKKIFEQDEVDWTQALDTLKRARVHLDELDVEASAGAQDPAAFFDKVGTVSTCISDALRLHASSIPPGLRGHIVLIGGHSRLQHYVLALRRHRPNKPVVVVTEDKASFFELRDRLVECKFFDMSLNISNLYHVFGRSQERFTLEEANVAQAESVVLMSDRHDDTTVLLGSFELEQIMEEIPPGQPRPKVLIDLAKDSSIYYCGMVLGGEQDNGPSIASTRSEDREPSDEANSADVRYWALFAAGSVWTTSIMDVFAVRTYFNAHVLSFFETLLRISPPCSPDQQLRQQQEQQRMPPQQQQQQQQLQVLRSAAAALEEDDEDEGGEKAEQKEEEKEAGPSSTSHQRKNADGDQGDATASAWHEDNVADAENFVADTDTGRCQFAHLRVSASFEGKTYGQLARYLIKRGAIPLGLYRAPGTKGSTLAYTHINPDPEELLHPWPRKCCGASQKGERGGGRMERKVEQGDDGGESDDGGVWTGREQEFEGGWENGAFDRQENVFHNPLHGAAPRKVKDGRRRGDDVFVILSKPCALSGEV